MAVNQTNLERWSDTPIDILISELDVTDIPLKMARRFMEKWHYSGGLGNAAMPWGCYHNPTGILTGVVAFQTPISENARDFIFGEGICECDHVEPKECNRDDCKIVGKHHHYGEHVTDLHRLAVRPEAPKNTGSWLISKGLTALKQYKPKYWAVTSMADSTEGHDGTQYQGANADYYGMTGCRKEYIDDNGQLRSPRQCGENITLSEAKERGWEVVERGEKHRYIFWLPYLSGRSKDGLREFANIELKPYPD